MKAANHEAEGQLASAGTGTNDERCEPGRSLLGDVVASASAGIHVVSQLNAAWAGDSRLSAASFCVACAAHNRLFLRENM